MEWRFTQTVVDGSWARQYEDIVKRAGNGDFILVYDVSRADRSSGNVGMSDATEGLLGVAKMAIESLSKTLALRVDFKDEGYSLEVVFETEDSTRAEDLIKDINSLISSINASIEIQKVGMPWVNVTPLVKLLSEIKVTQDGKYVSVELLASDEELRALKDAVGLTSFLTSFNISNPIVSYP